MTTQPPSHEEVQQLLDQLRRAWPPPEIAVNNAIFFLESLLADNVRLSGELAHDRHEWNIAVQELGDCRERIAALEKDAARYRYIRTGAKGIYNRILIYSDDALDAVIDAALNPQCRGTATGREG